jgi:hypothetical protein
MMTMKLATHAMARITPGGTCGRVTGSAETDGAEVFPGWGMAETPSGSMSWFPDLLNKFKLNKFKLFS